MSVDLDDLLTQFLEMESELNMVSTVRHRPKDKDKEKKVSVLIVSCLAATDRFLSIFLGFLINRKLIYSLFLSML